MLLCSEILCIENALGNCFYFFVCRMEDKSDSVRLQLRIGNNIYSATVTSNAVAEILMNKEKSSIVKVMSKGTPESVVVGKFKEKVEIMSVSQMDGQAINANNNAEEVMEVEVKYNAIKAHLSIVYKISKTIDNAEICFIHVD